MFTKWYPISFGQGAALNQLGKTRPDQVLAAGPRFVVAAGGVRPKEPVSPIDIESLSANMVKNAQCCDGLPLRIASGRQLIAWAIVNHSKMAELEEVILENSIRHIALRVSNLQEA